MTAFRLVPEAKLRDWAWRLERDMRRGHQCDVARNAESVMQAIAAVIAAPAPVIDVPELQRLFAAWWCGQMDNAEYFNRAVRAGMNSPALQAALTGESHE